MYATKKYYEKDKEYYKEKTKLRKENTKVWISELKAVLKCEKCYEDDPACLDFHHSNPSVKEFSIGAAVTRGFSRKRIEEEIKKCSVLCSNCHRKLHYYENLS